MLPLQMSLQKKSFDKHLTHNDSAEKNKYGMYHETENKSHCYNLQLIHHFLEQISLIKFFSLILNPRLITMQGNSLTINLTSINPPNFP